MKKYKMHHQFHGELQGTKEKKVRSLDFYDDLFTYHLLMINNIIKYSRNSHNFFFDEYYKKINYLG